MRAWLTLTLAPIRTSAPRTQPAPMTLLAPMSERAPIDDGARGNTGNRRRLRVEGLRRNGVRAIRLLGDEEREACRRFLGKRLLNEGGARAGAAEVAEILAVVEKSKLVGERRVERCHVAE